MPEETLASDAHRLLGQLPEQEMGPKAAEAVALLALVAGNGVESAEDSAGTDAGGGSPAGSPRSG